MDQLKVFSGNANFSLAQEIANYLEKKIDQDDLILGQVKYENFSNSNFVPQVQDNVRGRDVFVVQTLINDHDIVELGTIIYALKFASAARITAVIPYFSYSRSDRKNKPRIPITAKWLVKIIEASEVDRFLVMDLHCDQVQIAFDVPFDQLQALPVFRQYFDDDQLKDCVALAPDFGSGKKVGFYAKVFNLPVAFADKRRDGDKTVENTVIIGNVKGKDVIIFDDEIATGNTIITAVEALKKAGCGEIIVAATHGVLCGPAIDCLSNADIKKVVVTNTVNVPKEKRFRKLKVLSVGHLFGEAIRRIHLDLSVGELLQIK